MAAHSLARKTDVICTRCGQRNDDAERACTKCGRKLQSFFTVPDYGPAEDETDGLRLEFRSFNGRFLRQCLEAWALLLVVLGVAAYGAATGDWLPMYVALPLAAALAWFRGV